MRYLLILLLVLSGCSQRENAKAAIQADQAIAGAQRLLETRDDRALASAKDLLASARTSLAPVITELSRGEIIRVDTTVDEAVYSPNTFVRKATMQAARAGVETENNAYYSALFESSIMDMLAAGLAGTGTIGLVVAKLLQVYRRNQQAIEDQIAYHKDRAAVKSEEDIKAVKKKHIARQTANGTKGIIDAKLYKYNTSG
jgi:N-acyl-L-homoserine lactone synthetase